MKFFLVILIFITFGNSMLYAEDLYIPGNEHLYKNQWGALEDVLNDLKNKTISTDECIIYGCYILAAKEPSNTDKDIKAKLIPTKYDLNKKSKEDGPCFFVYYLYKFYENAGDKAKLEFKQSDWSDHEFIDEIINNEKLVKIILETPMLKDGNGKNYIHYCEVMNKAAQNNIVHFDTLRFKNVFPHIETTKYIKLIQPFEEKYNLKCFGNTDTLTCSNSLNGREIYFTNKHDQTFTKIPNNIQRKRKLINIINYYFYCMNQHNELKNK